MLTADESELKLPDVYSVKNRLKERLVRAKIRLSGKTKKPKKSSAELTEESSLNTEMFFESVFRREKTSGNHRKPKELLPPPSR